VWSNNVIAVTSDESVLPANRGVWRIDTDGTTVTPHLIAQINSFHLEGVVTLTNDATQWGPWAGKIITGDEDLSMIFAVDTNGVTAPYALGIDPEDFDIIPPDQDLYCVDPAGLILKVSRNLLINYVGDLVVTQAGEHGEGGKLFIVHWDNLTTKFVTRSISYYTTYGFAGVFEHVTFAPINLPNLP